MGALKVDFGRIPTYFAAVFVQGKVVLLYPAHALVIERAQTWVFCTAKLDTFPHTLFNKVSVASKMEQLARLEKKERLYVLWETRENTANGITATQIKPKHNA